MTQILQLSFLQDSVEKSADQERVRVYKELLDYHSLDGYAETAVSDLQNILKNEQSLEQALIQNWVMEHKHIFFDKFLHFGFDYLDVVNDRSDTLYLPHLNEHVNKSPFICIVAFWECMWLLYGGQYHLDRSKRMALDSKDYYSNTGGQENMTDLEQVLSFLKFQL